MSDKAGQNKGSFDFTAAKDPSQAGWKDGYAEELRYTFTTECDDFKGDAGACFRMGEWHSVVKNDREKSLEIYLRNCSSNNHAKSCFNAAAIYLSQKNKKSDRQVNDPLAFELAKKACSLNHIQACDVYATQLFSGIGCEKNVKEGMKALETSCSKSYAPSCYRLGSMYLQSNKDHGIEKDFSKARPYMEKACRFGHPASCHTLAVMYRRGDGVEKDEKMFKMYAQMTKDLVKATGERLGATVPEVQIP